MPGYEFTAAAMDVMIAAERLRSLLIAAGSLTLHTMIEVTDLVPTLVRDRVRSRCTLNGLLTPAGVGTNEGALFAAFDLTSAELATDGRTVPVDPSASAFAAAQPDPLAAQRGSAALPSQ